MSMYIFWENSRIDAMRKKDQLLVQLAKFKRKNKKIDRNV